MNRSTTLFLFVLVLALGGVAWWQTSREERGEFDYVERFFEGVDVARVVGIRVDNLERSVQVTLERDGRNAWSVTDPIAYPARRSVTKALLDIVREEAVTLVPADQAEAAEAGFDPPRSIFEVVEVVGEGEAAERVTTRVELGQHDLDGSRMYVRVRGRVFRALRNLDTFLQQAVDGYRDQRVFRIEPDRVVRLARRAFGASGQKYQAGLQAHRQQFRWWIDAPVKGQADPNIFGLLVAHLASLRVSSFVDDSPELLSVYGLQAPVYEIELESRDGEIQVLQIGKAGGKSFAKRVDLPYVWSIDSTNLSRAYMAAEALLDHNLVRVLRAEISRFEVENGESRLVVERSREGINPRALGSRDHANWTVRSEAFGAESGGNEDAVRYPANREAVERILSALEHVEIIRYLEDVSPENYFSDAPRVGVWLQLRDERQGGRVGLEYRTDGGGQATTFRRDGESEICLIPTDLAGLLAGLEFEDLISLQLFDTDEVRLRRLTVRYAGQQRRYFRSTQGTWRYEDLDTAATELFSVLDSLFFLKAERHLGVASGELENSVEVEIVDSEGNVTEWVLGPLADASPGAEGEATQVFVVDHEGRRSLLADQELHGRLTALFETAAAPR